jgi:uncharacterized protein
MPYPGEHACRLVPPVIGAPTRRKNGAQKHNGKSYDVIFQEQDGSWVAQAFRYPRETWSAESARSHCKSHDGTFEAASEEKSMDEKETRAFPISEIRVEGDKKPKIVGYASVFNQMSEDLGGFKEVVKPGAFAKTIKESDIRALMNHDPNYVLGRKKNGTLTLAEDEHGLRISIDPPDTSYARDLCRCIERGDIDQMSFGFKTIKDDWHTEDGQNVRELRECRLLDVSCVTYPAYPQTSIAMRSLEAFQKQTKAGEPGDHSQGEPSVKEHSTEPPAHSHGEEWRRAQLAKLDTIKKESE